MFVLTVKCTTVHANDYFLCYHVCPHVPAHELMKQDMCKNYKIVINILNVWNTCLE